MGEFQTTATTMPTKDITDIQVLEAYMAYHRDGEKWPHLGVIKWPYDYLMEETGQPEKVCYRAMERAAKRDLIDYGVSLRTGWLTDKGLALLTGNAAVQK